MDTLNVSSHNKDSVASKSDFILFSKSNDSILIKNYLEKKDLKLTIQVDINKEKFFKYISNDALFSTLITLFVFTLGIIINYGLKKHEQRKSRQEIRTFIKQRLVKIKDSVAIKLQESYFDFSVKTTLDSGITLTPPKLLTNDFQRILSIDSKELFSSIKKTKELSDIISQIDFLSNLRDEVQSYHETTLSRNNVLREKLSISIKNYMNSLADFVDYEAKNTTNYQDSEPYIKINNSIIEFYRAIAGKRELLRFYKNILRANQEYLIHSNLYQTHNIAKDIALQGKDLTHLFQELMALTTDYKNQYFEFSEMVKECINVINDSTVKIDWK